METPTKGYFRYYPPIGDNPGSRVRLRHGYVTECVGYDKDENGKVTPFEVKVGDRVAIPLTTYPQVSTTYGYPQTALHQFEILGKQAAGSASLQAAGIVAPPTREDVSSYNSGARSYLHGDTVYFVRGDEVWSTSWFAPSEVQGPF